MIIDNVNNNTNDSSLEFYCAGCGHQLVRSYQLRTQDYCYLCDPNITVVELLSDEPIVKQED